MKQVEIHFKSGGVVVVDATDFKANQINGDFTAAAIRATLNV